MIIDIVILTMSEVVLLFRVVSPTLTSFVVCALSTLSGPNCLEQSIILEISFTSPLSARVVLSCKTKADHGPQALSCLTNQPFGNYWHYT